MAQRVRSTHNQYVTACMHQEDESSKDILHTSNSAAVGSICPSIVIAAGRSVLVLRTRASHRLRRGSPHRMEESRRGNCIARHTPWPRVDGHCLACPRRTARPSTPSWHGGERQGRRPVVARRRVRAVDHLLLLHLPHEPHHHPSYSLS